jgi:hypothetical protein
MSASVPWSVEGLHDDMVATTNAIGGGWISSRVRRQNNVPVNVKSDLPAKFAAVEEQINAY